MPYDGIITSAVVYELSGILNNARIEKIHQTAGDEIILLCNKFGDKYRLLINVNATAARMHFTKSKKENPLSAPPFCMVLRKYIQSGRIVDIKQEGLDRIITFTIETKNEMGDDCRKHLIVEIMGKYSNIILTNGSGVIHDSIIHVDSSMSSIREVMPARIYTLPPAQDKKNPQTVGESTIFYPDTSNVQTGKMILNTLSGFSPLVCNFICSEAGLDPKTIYSSLSSEQLEGLNIAAKKVCADIAQNRYYPLIFTDIKDYHCLAVCNTVPHRSKNTVNDMLDEFYLGREQEDRLKQKKQAVIRLILNAVEKTGRTLNLLENILEESSDYENCRVKGELLTANMYRLSEYSGDIELEDYSTGQLQMLKVELEEKIPVTRNAQNYFRKYKKQKKSYETALERIEEYRLELEYLKSVEVFAENAEDLSTLDEIKKELTDEGYGKGTEKNAPVNNPSAVQNKNFPGKPASKAKALSKAKAQAAAKGRNNLKKSTPGETGKETSSPLKFVISDGYTVYVGKNSRQNDKLTLKDSKPDDIWFHLKNSPGSHVVLKTSDKEGKVTEKAIFEAARICAYYSSARESTKAEIDYTRVKNVKKTAGARPGMVFYTNYKTIIVKPKQP